jgi:TolB-like protein
MKKFLIFLLIFALYFCTINGAFAQENVLSQKVSELADKLAFAVEGYVAGVSGETVYIDLGQESGIVEGIQFEVVRLDKDNPFKKGEKIIGYPETEVGQIEITKVRKEMSLAKITKKVTDIQEGDKVYQVMKKVTRIAITEFTYGNEFNDFTRNVQDILYTNLIQRGMTVVEREKMEQVLEELGESFSGMIDSSTAAEIGKMLGVEAIVVGTVADMGNSVDLRARLVDVEKGAALTAVQIDVVKDPTIIKILSNGRREAIYGKGGITSTKEVKTIQEVNAQSFNFKLIDWQKKGEGIYFDIIITSDQDSWLTLYWFAFGYGRRRARFFDDFGNEYNVSKVQLGNKFTSGVYNSVNNILVTGVPMKAIFSFDNLSPQTKIIPLLEIICEANNKYFSVQFRNIPILQ